MASLADLHLPGSISPSAYLTKLANSTSWQAFCPGSGTLTPFMRSILARIDPSAYPPSVIRSAIINVPDIREPVLYQRVSAARFLYRGRGGWDFMDKCRIIESKVVQSYNEDKRPSNVHMLEADVIHDTSGATSSMKYVAKSWHRHPGRWNGLHTELGILQDEKYLLPLQGKVVPYVVGIYANPLEATIAMTPPHGYFWIEASPSMPEVLQERVISAYEQIHARGVVHGNVALRHILIGGDARVTIVDFSKARADEPSAQSNILRTGPNDKDMEMRRVKFLLDYKGARAMEMARSNKESERKKRVDPRKVTQQDRRGFLGLFRFTTCEAPESTEDADEGAIPLDELHHDWMADADRVPRRFVHPNMNDDELGLGIIIFCEKVQELVVGSHIPQVSMPPYGVAPSQVTPDLLWDQLLEDPLSQRSVTTGDYHRVRRRPAEPENPSTSQNIPAPSSSTPGSRGPRAANPPPNPSSARGRELADEPQPSERVRDRHHNHSGGSTSRTNGRASQAGGPVAGPSNRTRGQSTRAAGSATQTPRPRTRAAGSSSRTAGSSSRTIAPPPRTAASSTHTASRPAQAAGHSARRPAETATQGAQTETRVPGNTEHTRRHELLFDDRGRAHPPPGMTDSEFDDAVHDELMYQLTWDLDEHGFPRPECQPGFVVDPAMQRGNQPIQTRSRTAPPRSQPAQTGSPPTQVGSQPTQTSTPPPSTTSETPRTRSHTARTAGQPNQTASPPESQPARSDSAQKRPHSGTDEPVVRKKARFSTHTEVMGVQEAAGHAGPSAVSTGTPRSILRMPRSDGGGVEDMVRDSAEQAQDSSSQTDRVGKRKRDSSPSPEENPDPEDGSAPKKRGHFS